MLDIDDISIYKRKIKIAYTGTEVIDKICLRTAKARTLLPIPFFYKYTNEKTVLSIGSKKVIDLLVKKGEYDLVFFTSLDEEIEYMLSIRPKMYLLDAINESMCIILGASKRQKLKIFLDNKDVVFGKIFSVDAFLSKAKLDKQGLLTFKVTAKISDNMQIIGSSFRLRRGINEIEVPIKKQYNLLGKNSYLFELNVNEYKWDQFYWDCFLLLKYEQQIFSIRVKNKSLMNVSNLMYRMGKNEYHISNKMILYPYITLDLAFSLNCRPLTKYETPQLFRRDYLAFITSLLIGWLFKIRRPILVHEKFSQSAQDNSFYFFKYYYDNHKHVPIYFVIDKNSPDYNNLKGMDDRIIDFMSFKHLLYIYLAKYIISSESKGHGYAWRINKGWTKNKLNQKKYIFLQHGVIGFKILDNTFKAWGVNHADLFVVSNSAEKEIVHKYLKYPNKQIIETGLPRWDYLEPTESKNKQILYMPTWRNWLDTATDEEFIQSEFVQKIYELLGSKELVKILEMKKCKMIFYLHPRLYEKQSLFQLKQSEFIKFVQFGEKDLKTLVSTSSLVITDYSSVAWDSYYQNIPVVFYQFDINKYLEHQGFYVDFKEYAFGPVVKNKEELFEEIKKISSKQFRIDQKYIAMKDSYFTHIDKHNNDRIYNEIQKYSEKVGFFKRIKHEAVRNLYIKTIRYNVKRIIQKR